VKTSGLGSRLSPGRDPSDNYLPPKFDSVTSSHLPSRSTYEANNANNGTRWDFETQVINQYPVTKRLGDIDELNHLLA
jgi:hypothetical protein